MKTFNFFEKLWEHGRTLRRVGLVLVMCLMTITQMWAGVDGNKTIFLDLSNCSWYMNDGYYPKIEVLKGDNTYYKHGHDEQIGDHIFRFEVDASAKAIQFFRVNGESEMNHSGFMYIDKDNYDGDNVCCYKYYNYYIKSSDGNGFANDVNGRKTLNSTGGEGYFYAGNLTTTNYVSLLMGRWDNSKAATMSLMSNTEKLYYSNSLAYNIHAWTAIIGTTSEWTDANEGASRLDYAPDHTYQKYGYQFLNGSKYYMTKDGTDAGTGLNIEYKANYSDIPKYTTTLNIKVKEGGSSSYTNGSTSKKPATTIQIQGTNITVAGSSGATRTGQTASWSSGSSCSFASVISGAVTVSYSSLGSDWNFDGWYIDDVQVGTGTSYDFYQHANTTVEARFTKKYTVTYSNRGAHASHNNVPASPTEYLSGATVTVKDNTELMWCATDGKVFAGWATTTDKADAGTVDYVPGESGKGTGKGSFDITSDVTLYPVWIKGSYLFQLKGSDTSSDINTTDFGAGGSREKTALEVNGVTFSKTYYKTSSDQSSIKQQYQNPNNFIVYDTKSTATTIRVYVKNTDTSSKNVYYLLAKEGSISESDQTVSLAAGEAKVINIDASNDKGTRVILCTNKSSKVYFAQIIAIESGETLPLPGETGYELAFPGRVANHFPNINGIEITGQAADLKWNYGNVLKLRSGSSKYLKFTTTAATKLQVKIQSGKGFYVCTDKSSPSTTGFLTSGSTAGTKDIYLDAANTYYIMGENGSNDTKIEKVSFAAHSTCTAPTGLAVGSITYNGATFTVTDGTNANNYEFYVSKSSTAPEASSTPTHTSTNKTYAITGLDKNSTYYAWVRTNGGYFHKSAWTALTGTSFKTLNAYDITYNCDGEESGCPSTGVGLTLPDPLPGAPFKPGYNFDGWYTNSAKTISAVAGADIAANTTLYAKWTKVYATTMNFAESETRGTDPNDQTLCTKSVDNKYCDHDAFRVDNYFFSATKLQYETGNASDKYNGWKCQYNGATIKFYVENDCTVAVAMGANAGCSIKYTPIDGSETTENLPTSDNQTTTKDVKGGTMVTLTTTSGSTVTLKSITITDKAACSAPTSPSISGTTSYTYGGKISLTATCATGTDASTTYTWYKGSDWATASSSSPVQAASTSGATFSKTAAMSDAGTYWCEAANSTCTSHNSSGYAITVAKASISPSLSYSSTTLTTGDNSSSPTVTGNSGSGSVSYAVTSSSPSGCITVNGSTGVVTAVAAGTGTVTATIAATDNYLGGTATADFTVTDPCFYANDLKKKDGGGDIAKDAEITASMLASGTITGGTLQNTSGAKLSHNKDYGLVMESGKQVTLTLTSPKIFEAGTVITVKSYSSNQGASDKTDYNKYSGIIVGTHKLADSVKCTSNTPALFTQSYTVTTSDGIEGGNSVVFKRTTAKTYIYSIKVTGCGERSGYTVTYDDNGSTSGSVPVDGDSPYDEDATVTVLGNTGSLAKNGYTFAGWSNGVTTYTAGNTFSMPATNVTLTAVWTPNTYDITYHENGASYKAGYTAPATYTVGTGATLPTSSNMTNTGYTFGGWYANSGLTGSSVTTIGTSEYGDKEFWAKWTENTYAVTYSANGGTGDAMSNTEGHYVTLSANTYTKSGYIFAGWNTATDGSGASYSEGEEIELKANLDLYAIWAEDYTITWDASPKLSGVDAKPNLGGGNYTITASVATWTGSLTTSMISAETSGVTITGVSVENSASPKTITATFNVGASVVGDKISFTLDVPANGSFSAKSDTEDFDIDRCTGSGSGSDGVLFSAEFKDSGLGASDICTAANTDYTFTTSELKAAPTGGSIKASTTSNLSHMKYATNAISIAGSNGVIRIDLDNEIATNDLFTYVNVNSSSSSAYLRHTSPTNTTDQIALTVYNSKEAKVRLTSGFNGETTLYIVRNNNDFKLHKAAVVRPAFLMLLRDDTPTSDTNLSGTDVSLTTENYLAVISGGSATFTSPSSGNLKIKRSNSKNYINFNSQAGYVKIVLNDALQEGDVIGFDSYNTNELALTITATRSTTIRTTSQLYTVGSSSPLKDQTMFYLWQNSGSSDFLRGLQIARSGVAGGGGGTDKITTTLTWDTDLSSGVAAETGDADFTHTVTQDKNSLGAITYSSSNTSVATVNASGKVHIAGAGNATITAIMAASGCYKEATVSYNITVTDNCDDTPGTITSRDLECEGTELTVSEHTALAGVSYQWYKDGVSMGVGYTAAKCTVTVAGEYYVVVDNTAAGEGHCAKASTNTITLEGNEAATASNIVNSWYVKNGRRTPDIALVQTENATDFTVTSGGSPITTFAGCAFYLGTDGIIYLSGQQEDGSAPTGLTSGDETITITATACGGNASPLDITIHKQESTTRPSVAFVVDGTKEGAFDAENEDHSVNTELYQFLNYNLSTNPTGKFDLTGQNVYSTVDEQAIREHYSQFDAILITDDPSTDTKIGKKSCVDAFGTMIDVRPILTMEAFVSKWPNWKAKGIDGNPESPNPRQYKMKLQCKDHAIFKGLSVGTNVETETIDGVEYWTVTMVDNTKSPYSGVADGTDTDTKPALQGFSADDVNSLLLLGEISGGSLYAGVERQEETAARLMLLGLNAKALPNALTPEGKKVIENALKYLIETDLEKVDDCSNYFTGATDKDWNKDSNWSKGHVPNSPNVRVRILSECVINSGTYKVAEVDIATSGKSLNKAGEMTGKLTINAGAALIVGGKIRTAKAPYFNTGDLKPTTEEDLVINTSSTAQAALIFNNDAGDTKATVNLYSLGRNEGGAYQFQYFAVPMTYIDVNPAFAGSGIYTYVWNEASGWERRGYYVGLEAFEGVGITTKFADATTYQMKGTLASTATKEITLTHEDEGHNLIGNSWTAPIQISQLEEDNSSLSKQTVYIYNTGNDDTAADGYGTGAGQWTAIPFNAAGFDAWDGLKVIPAMQAFEIVPDEEETLTLDYDKVVRGDNQTLTEPLRAPKASHEGIELMRIRVADSNAHADLYLFEGSTFSDEFDNGWEAAYMDGDDGTTKLYADVALGRMAVVATDELEGTLLGFAPGKETEYTFTFGGEGMGYYLNDLKLMKSTLINEEATYSFTFEEGDTNRFYISRTPIEAPQTPTGVDNTRSGEVKAQKFIYNDKMYIMINGRVYSAEGQIVK